MFFICALSLLGLFACDEKKMNSHLPCKIDFEKSINKFLLLELAEIADEIRYIRLESKQYTRISTTYLLDFSEDFLLVSDRKNCFLFDNQGKFISKIGNAGRGPGEYTHISNVKIDSKSNNVLLQSGRSILRYDNNGLFIQKFIPEMSVGTRIIGSWNLFQDTLFFGQVPNYSGKEKYKSVIFDDSGKTIQAFNNTIFLNRESEIINANDGHANIYQFEDKYFFKERMNDTLFVIIDDTFLEPAYIFNLGRYAQPLKERELGMFKMVKRIDNYIFINNIFETRNFIFLDCNFNNHSPAKRLTPVEKYGTTSLYYNTEVLGVYNKTSKKLIFSQLQKLDNKLLNTGLYNNYDGGLNFYPRKMVNDSILAMSIDAYQLKAHVASEVFKNSKPKYPEKKKELERLANSLDGNDNPVLMLVTLKE